MLKKYPLIITILTGVCILVDKYAAKWYAEVYIKPEFELLWVLILYLVLFQQTDSTKDKKMYTVIAAFVLAVITIISVYKIYYFQV